MSWTSYHHDYPATGSSDIPALNSNTNRAETPNGCVAANIRTACCRQQANNNIRSLCCSTAVDVGHDMPYPLMSTLSNKQAVEAAYNSRFESIKIVPERTGKFLANVVYSETMHKSDVISLAWNGCLLASGGADKSIRVFEVCESTHNGEEKDGAISSTPHRDTAAQEVSEIHLLERDFSPISDSHRYHVNCVTFFPDSGENVNPLLASCSTDGVLCLWNARDGTKVARACHPFTTQAPLRVCRFSPCGTFIAAAGDDEKIAVWKLTRNADFHLQVDLHKVFIGPNERTVMSLVFSPDSSVIVSGATAGASAGGDLRAWDVMSELKQPPKELFIEREAHDLGVTCGDVSQHWWDEKQRIALLVTGGYDNFVKVWHMRCGSGIRKDGIKEEAVTSIRLHMQLTGHTADVCDCRLSNTKFAVEQLVVSASNDRSIIVWTLTTGSPLAVISGFARFVRCVCFSPDDKFVASGDGSGRVALFALSSVKNAHSSSNCGENGASTAACLTMPPPSYEQAVKTDVFGGKRFSVSEIDKRYGVSLGDKQRDPKQKVHANLARYKSSPAGETSSVSHQRLPLCNKISATYFNQNMESDVAENDSDHKIPDEYICPISRTVMKEPVVAADGFTYDRSAIEAVFGQKGAVSSVTGAPLAHDSLVPNRTLAMMIDKFNLQSIAMQPEEHGGCETASRDREDTV